MNKKRLMSISAIVLGLPLLGLALSVVTAQYSVPATTNNDGIGNGKALIVLGAAVIGVVGLVLSLLLGPVIGRFVSPAKHRYYALLGYVIPSGTAFLYVLYGFVSVVIAGNPSPY